MTMTYKLKKDNHVTKIGFRTTPDILLHGSCPSGEFPATGWAERRNQDFPGNTQVLQNNGTARVTCRAHKSGGRHHTDISGLEAASPQNTPAKHVKRT